MSALLEVSGVSKAYPGVQALKDVSLSVDAGTVHAVIGPNGAGKSTLFAVVNGDLAPSAGRVRFGERDVQGVGLEKAARLGIGRCFQVPKLYTGMRVDENLLTAALLAERLRGQRSTWRGRLDPWRERRGDVERLAEEVGLAGRLQRLAGELPHGDKKRLELGMALAAAPTLLLLDEPTAGMSPEETAATVELLLRVREDRPVTVVLTEHDMDVVFRLASRITVLNQGEVVTSGPPQEIREDPRVVEIYLGAEA